MKVQQNADGTFDVYRDERHYTPSLENLSLEQLVSFRNEVDAIIYRLMLAEIGKIKGGRQ